MQLSFPRTQHNMLTEKLRESIYPSLLRNDRLSTKNMAQNSARSPAGSTEENTTKSMAASMASIMPEHVANTVPENVVNIMPKNVAKSMATHLPGTDSYGQDVVSYVMGSLQLEEQEFHFLRLDFLHLGTWTLYRCCLVHSNCCIHIPNILHTT